MTQVKKHTSKRLVNFILAMAMVIGMIPTTTITAFAASGTYQLSKNEINSTWLLDSGGPGSKKPYHLSPSQYDRIMNYGQDTSSPDYQGFSESSWFWPAYEELMDMGVILGIQTNHSDTNSPIYMPTLPTSDLRSKTDADGFISGQDALGAALLYTETVIDYSSSEYNEELLQKNVNFGNMFGEVPGANLFQLNVSTVETSSLNLADGINWNTSQMSSSIGYVNASADGLTVDMYGNSSNAGQNMMYCLDYQGEITFGFDYSLSWGDSFNGAGIVMNIAQSKSSRFMLPRCFPLTKMPVAR